MKKKVWITCLILFVILVAVAAITYPQIRDTKAYQNAEKLLQAGDYDRAIASYEALAEKNYRDAAEKAAAGREAKEKKLSEDYRAALDSLKAKQYGKAKTAFEALGGYEDSVEYAGYSEALLLLETQEFEKAYAAFSGMSGFEASADYASYAEARLKEIEGLFEEAGKIYADIYALNDSFERYSALHEKILARDYEKAMELFESGSYEEALELLSTKDLLKYEDSVNVRYGCEYKIAEAELAAGDYDAAEAGFTLLAEAGFGDAAEMVKEARYQKGRMLAEQEDYERAYEVLSSIIEYSDVRAYIDSNSSLSFIEKYAPGKILIIGSYPTDQTFSNMEKIEWRILAADGNKRLLISEKCITAVPYNYDLSRVTWETSTVREFVRGIALAALKKEFRNTIIPVTNANPDNPDYRTEGGNATEDTLFLLSIEEVKKYFPNPEDRVAYPMKHAVSNGILCGNDGSVWWWLRSPGNITETAACVSYENGALSIFGQRVDERRFGIRPAMWVDIEAYDAIFG